jgi:hypothetical protein
LRGTNALAYVGSMGTQKSFMILTQGPRFVRMTQDHSSKSLLLNEKDRYNNERVAKRQRQKCKRERNQRGKDTYWETETEMERTDKQWERGKIK